MADRQPPGQTVPVRRGRGAGGNLTNRPVVRTRFEVLEPAVRQASQQAKSREAEAAQRTGDRAGARVDPARLPANRVDRQLAPESVDFAAAEPADELAEPETEAGQEPATRPSPGRGEATSQRQPTPAQQLVQAGRQRAIQATKQAAKQAATQAVKKAAAALVLDNPVTLTIIAVVIGIIAIGLLLFALISMTSVSDPAGSGASQTVEIDTSNQANLTALKKTIDGGVDNVAKAEAVLKETKKVRPQLANNAEALAILDAIDKAAQAIIAADSKDTKTIKDQATIISKKIKALENTQAPTTACTGDATCLNVEPIAASVPTHCGRVSVLMVLRYLNIGSGDKYFKQDQYITSDNGHLVDAAKAESCVETKFMNEHSPLDRRGWNRQDWHNISVKGEKKKKDVIMQIIQRSIDGGDPVILFANPGGIAKGQHVVVVVGYKPKKAPVADVTYIINNPNTVKTIKGTDTGFGGRKLTGERLETFLGGGNTSPFPKTSIIVRDKHVDR